MLLLEFTLLQVSLTVAAAVAIDRLLGEPRRWHPLVGFGHLAGALEKRFNDGSKVVKQLSGMLCGLLLAMVIGGGLQWALQELPPVSGLIASALVLYLTIGWRSLEEHAMAVHDAVQSDNLERSQNGIDSSENSLERSRSSLERSTNSLERSRNSLAQIVSRDTENLTESDISKATIESILENGSDAVLSPIFWFVLLGPFGAVLYRVINTLDAMWGYRTERFRYFGWFAARCDDLLNWFPARMMAFSYCLSGQFLNGIRCWNTQARLCVSPNGGPTMCSGAGALKVQLGGATSYHGQLREKPVMGSHNPASIDDIARSIRLLRRAILLWLLALVVISCAWDFLL